MAPSPGGWCAVADTDEPLTWQALQVIRELVEGITTDAGYRTDLGLGTVITDRSRLKLQGNTPITLIVAGEVVVNPDASGQRTTADDMDVTVEVAIPFESDNVELVAHRARADLVRAFKTDLRGRVAGFRSFAVTGSGFSSDADDKGLKFTLVQVTARAGLTETATPAT